MTPYEEQFEVARLIYPGRKRGLLTEFANFKKKHKDWKEVLSLLALAIQKQEDEKARLLVCHEFCPRWPDFATWINGRRWEDEMPAPQSAKKALNKSCVKCGRPGTIEVSGKWYCGSQCRKARLGW